MNLDQLAEVVKSRIPTAGEFLDLMESLGWRLVVHEDGRAGLRVKDARDPLAVALARMLRREPYRTNVVAEVRARQSPPPAAPVEAPVEAHVQAHVPEAPGRPGSDPVVRSRVVDADTGEVWWESREAFGVYRECKRVIAALGAAGCGRRFAIERRDPFSDACEWYELWSEQHGTAGVGRPGDGAGQPSVPAAADGGGADGSLWAPARAGVVPVAGHRA